MSLITRLGGIGDPENVGKIGVDPFFSLFGELAAGRVTRQQIVDYFGLSAGDAEGLDAMVAEYNARSAPTGRAAFVERARSICLLAEIKAPGYTTEQAVSGYISAA